MAYDIFISHSSKDKAVADATCACLESRGLRCWIAPRDIVAGAEWGASIIDGIQGSKAMVLILSSHSNVSPQVLREIERADNRRIPIVPFRIQDVVLSKSLEYFLSSAQWLDAYPGDLKQHLETLANNVAVVVGNRDATRTPPDQPAPTKPVAGGAVPQEGQCAACGVRNNPAAKYCRNCAASLSAPCLGCGEAMPVWDEVCGACGAKQSPLVVARQRDNAARQAKAEGLLGRLDFDGAAVLAAQLRDEHHPRIGDLGGWAKELLERIEAARGERTRLAVEAVVNARKHEAAFDYPAAIAVLETIPATLRGSVLPGGGETAAVMLGRLKATQAESQRLETLVKERLAAKQFDDLLPEVEKLLTLRPHREDLDQVRSRLLERQRKQATARDKSLEAAKARLAEHDYEGVIDALTDVAASATTQEVVSLRERAEGLVRRVRGLSQTIKEAVATNAREGLLRTVEQYLLLKPADSEAVALRQSLVEWEKKVSAENASRLAQARHLEQSCRFDEAVTLLEAIPESRRSRDIAESMVRANRLGALRGHVLAALSGAQSGSYVEAIAAAGEYRNALAASRIDDTEFTTLASRVEAAHEQEIRSRRLVRIVSCAAAGIAAAAALVATGLWLRSSTRAASLAGAIASGKWDGAIEIDPDNVAALVGRARARLADTPADVAGAFADLDRAAVSGQAVASVSAARADAHAVRAREHALADRLDEAADDLAEAQRGAATAGCVDAAREALARGWFSRAQDAHRKGDASRLQQAVAAAIAAGTEKSRLLGLWVSYGQSRIKVLDAKGLSLACKEAAALGLSADRRAAWWLEFGDLAAKPPREDAVAVWTAVEGARGEGADEKAIATLSARGAMLEAVAMLARDELKAAAARALEASRMDAAVATAELEKPAHAKLRLAVSRDSFDAAIAADDWGKALEISAAAGAFDRAASAWLGTAIAAHPRGLAAVPVDVLARLPVSVISGVPARMFAALPPASISAVPPATIAALPPTLMSALSSESISSLSPTTLAALPPATVSALSPASVSALPAAAISALSPSAIAALPQAAVSALPPATLAALRPAVMLKLPPLRNSVGIQLKLIPSGTFATTGSSVAMSREVTLTKRFYMGVHEVTNAQWKSRFGFVPGKWKDDDLPVYDVSWDDAVKFCQKLSELPEEKAAGRIYRLPTEAEWEFACRAGTTTEYSFGDDASALGEYAWFEGNSGGKTHPVGKKKPNPWGLYDMHGNVPEWCSDWYGKEWDSSYPPLKNPMGPSTGSERVLRNGGYRDSHLLCDTQERSGRSPGSGYGFRIAMSAPETSPTEAGK